MNKERKRGLSQVLSVIIIIVLVIIAIALIWVVISQVIKEDVEGTEKNVKCLDVDLTIDTAVCSGNLRKVRITRGADDIVLEDIAIKFLSKDGNSKIIYLTSDIPEKLETKTVSVDTSDIGFNPVEVSVAAILDGTGEEHTCSEAYKKDITCGLNDPITPPGGELPTVNILSPLETSPLYGDLLFSETAVTSAIIRFEATNALEFELAVTSIDDDYSTVSSCLSAWGSRKWDAINSKCYVDVCRVGDPTKPLNDPARYENLANYLDTGNIYEYTCNWVPEEFNFASGYGITVVVLDDEENYATDNEKNAIILHGGGTPSVTITSHVENQNRPYFFEQTPIAINFSASNAVAFIGAVSDSDTTINEATCNTISGATYDSGAGACNIELCRVRGFLEDNRYESVGTLFDNKYQFSCDWSNLNMGSFHERSYGVIVTVGQTQSISATDSELNAILLYP